MPKTRQHPRPKPTLLCMYTISPPARVHPEDRRHGPRHWLHPAFLSIRPTSACLPPTAQIMQQEAPRFPKLSRNGPKGTGGDAVIQQQEPNIPSLEQSACKSEIAPEGEPKAYPPKHHPILPTDTRRHRHNPVDGERIKGGGEEGIKNTTKPDKTQNITDKAVKTPLDPRWMMCRGPRCREGDLAPNK